VEHAVTSDLNLELSLAMTSARDAQTEENVPLVPRTTCTLVASYSRGAARYVTKLARVGSRSGLKGESLPPYVLLDLRGFLETRWGSVFAGIENVLDVLYEDEQGFPQPGRAFEVGIMRELYH
jgi:outer membrane receptor protein involved in Fe transport